MKIERKESGLVEFGSLKCGDVFEIDGSKKIWVKTRNFNMDRYPKEPCINCTTIDGEHGLVKDVALVKPYPNAKVVLED